MKILFLETPAPYLIRQHAQVPLGLLYLATVVEQAGYEVKFKRPINIQEISKYSGYDIICLSATTLEYPMTCEIVKVIRRKFPKIKILMGGTHATVLSEEVKNSNLFDSVCVGEGERTILHMITDIKENRLLPIYYPIGFIENLDSIPFPNRDLIEGMHGGRIFLDKETGNENIITARGCYFNCSFCASESIWHKTVRYRSTKNIITEIKQIIDKYGTKVFRIADENVTSNMETCLELCKEMKKLQIEWRCSIRAESISQEIAKALSKAGCREVSVGIESGDQRVLDFLNKRTTLQKMLKGCYNARKAGLKIRCLFMIGTPGERLDTPERNKKYLDKLAWDGITLATFIPLPGTSVFNNPEKFNCKILTKDFSLYNKDYYISKHGIVQKREYIPLIHNKFLTLDQQANNISRMEMYIEETGKYNKG